jgi:hypothetical protein
MKPLVRHLIGLCLFSLVATAVNAQSWASESLREFEELRLRQLQTVQRDGVISGFTSDGCSGGQSQGWELMAQNLPGFAKRFSNRPPWESCCLAHDRIYWRGSAVDGYARRQTADEELRQCVVATGASLADKLSNEYSVTAEQVQEAFALTADIMYRAVRLGGQPCSLLPWRWGYGWDHCAFAAVSEVPEHVSDIAADEHVTFFNTAASLDADGAHWQIPIHAWIYEPQHSALRKSVFATALESKYDLRLTFENEANFERRTNLLIADNERGKVLVIRLAGQDFTLPASSENGHILALLKLPVEVASAFSQHGRLDFFAVLPHQDRRRYEGQLRLVPRQGISVISDIDDTIKISDVTEHSKLFANTFFNDFREVDGMPDLYRRLVMRDVSLHFVSSSPWQLYAPLLEFMHAAGFPWATLDLKSVRFRDETLFNLFKQGTETKPAQIEPVLKRYPGRRFVLIGDSGEQDPEVYGDIARRYPDQIQRVLIRNVDNSKVGDARYREAFDKIPMGRWQLFDDAREISVDDLI